MGYSSWWGLICNGNMQMEGFWYYLFSGVFEMATSHYVVAKIFGPLRFDRGWCGYACWTAMVLEVPERKNGTECILCMEYVDDYPKQTIKF